MRMYDLKQSRYLAVLVLLSFVMSFSVALVVPAATAEDQAATEGQQVAVENIPASESFDDSQIQGLEQPAEIAQEATAMSWTFQMTCNPALGQPVLTIFFDNGEQRQASGTFLNRSDAVENWEFAVNYSGTSVPNIKGARVDYIVTVMEAPVQDVQETLEPELQAPAPEQNLTAPPADNNCSNEHEASPADTQSENVVQPEPELNTVQSPTIIEVVDHPEGSVDNQQEQSPLPTGSNTADGNTGESSDLDDAITNPAVNDPAGNVTGSGLARGGYEHASNPVVQMYEGDSEYINSNGNNSPGHYGDDSSDYSIDPDEVIFNLVCTSAVADTASHVITRTYSENFPGLQGINSRDYQNFYDIQVYDDGEFDIAGPMWEMPKDEALSQYYNIINYDPGWWQRSIDNDNYEYYNEPPYSVNDNLPELTGIPEFVNTTHALDGSANTVYWVFRVDQLYNDYLADGSGTTAKGGEGDNPEYEEYLTGITLNAVFKHDEAKQKIVYQWVEGEQINYLLVFDPVVLTTTGDDTLEYIDLTCTYEYYGTPPDPDPYLGKSSDDPNYPAYARGTGIVQSGGVSDRNEDSHMGLTLVLDQIIRPNLPAVSDGGTPVDEWTASSNDYTPPATVTETATPTEAVPEQPATEPIKPEVQPVVQPVSVTPETPQGAPAEPAAPGELPKTGADSLASIMLLASMFAGSGLVMRRYSKA